MTCDHILRQEPRRRDPRPCLNASCVIIFVTLMSHHVVYIQKVGHTGSVYAIARSTDRFIQLKRWYIDRHTHKNQLGRNSRLPVCPSSPPPPLWRDSTRSCLCPCWGWVTTLQVNEVEQPLGVVILNDYPSESDSILGDSLVLDSDRVTIRTAAPSELSFCAPPPSFGM